MIRIESDIEQGLKELMRFSMREDKIPEGHEAILNGVEVEFHTCDHVFTGFKLLDNLFNKDKKYPKTKYYRKER